MIVSSLSQMENLVDKNKNLSWDGWDVVSYAKKSNSEFMNNGSFNRNNGKWYTKTVYPCHENGWNIPDSVL